MVTILRLLKYIGARRMIAVRDASTGVALEGKPSLAAHSALRLAVLLFVLMPLLGSFLVKLSSGGFSFRRTGNQGHCQTRW
jgi:hypothetical protein